jgi:hypothetical protein
MYHILYNTWNAILLEVNPVQCLAFLEISSGFLSILKLFWYFLNDRINKSTKQSCCYGYKFLFKVALF